MRVKLNKFNVYPFAGFFLMPGWNDVPENIARMMLANPIVKYDIEAKTLEFEIEEEQPPVPAHGTEDEAKPEPVVVIPDVEERPRSKRGK